MKILLTLCVLFVSSSIFADDILDFDIEGMRLGDSLLNHMTEKQIEKALNNSFEYKDREFISIWFYSKIQFGKNNLKWMYDYSNSLYKFDEVHITFKPEDKNFTIHSIEGSVSFYTVDQCFPAKQEIKDIMQKRFLDLKIGKDNTGIKLEEYNKQPHEYDATGDSYYYASYFYNENGTVRIMCYDWSKELFVKEGWHDSLHLVVSSAEFDNFLSNDPY